ncbi:glycoside hydrolase superfamily, partial [Coniella lustricola]
KSWPALTSMSLRNEPREPTDNTTLDDDTYNWEYWYTYVKEGAAAINDANPDPLIFLSGLDFDTFLTPVVQKTALTPGTATFSLSDFPADKIVLELHNYDNSATDCASLESALLTDGFEAMDESSSAYNHFPVILTEWGFLMDDTTWQEPYTECLAAWAPNNTAGWMIWVLSGSYYIRSGEQDYDETWGLLNHDWSEWRNPTYVNESFIPMVSATKASA